MHETFSSFIIGEGALVAECAAILLEAGHSIRAIMTAHPQVVQWAHERGIRIVAPAPDVAGAMRAALAEQGGDASVDWGFSIVNPRILRGDTLALARRGAVNYHDAPLPRYAGTHATSWAILNGERRHAISWHLVVDRVDAGDILKQVPVDIEPTDTAFALNAKCYVAAIESFRELVDEITTGRLAGWAQDAAQRTFFARLRRPAAASVVRWDRPAAELSALARALEFGPVPNPLGRARVVFADGAALAPRIEPLDEVAADAPGTVVRVDDDAIVVCAADRLVAIRELRTLDGGAPLAIADAARTFAIHAGARLPLVDADLVSRLEARDAAARRGEDAWVKRLRTLAPLSLPYVRATSAGEGSATERIVAAVPEAMRAHLAQLTALDAARAPGELLLAACAAYWARVADAESTDVGLIVAGATDATDVERRLFVDSVPVSVAPPEGGGASFVAAAGAFLDRVAEAAARGPLLRDVVTRYPELHALAGREHALRLPVSFGLTECPDEAPAAASDVTVLVDRDATTWAWCFDAARIDAADVARMATHVAVLVAGASAAPDAEVVALPILDDAERRLVVEEWNDTARPYPRDQTIAQRFAECVAARPDAVAVVDRSRTLTYRELDARANRLARRLRALGVGRDTLVGLCIERSAEMIVGALGILKAGGAYVTLDPDYPRERLALMLADTGAPVVVTQASLAARLPSDATGAGVGGPAVVRLDADWPSIAAEDPSPLAEVCDAESLAYVIFTSGSTGVPKGVAAVHRGVMRLVCNPDFAELGPNEVLLSFAPLNFDASTLEIWGALLNGGKLVVFPGHTPSLDELSAVIAEHGVTTLWLTAALFHQFVDAHLEGLRPLRQLLAGGDVLSVPHVRRVREALPHVRLINGYGPTENTTFTCCHTIAPAESLGSGPVPIGRPVASTTVYILDARMRPVPVGVPGRLYTGGDGLARGYLNRPELTAEKFIADPFSALPGARMYDTGDLARWRADGTVEFLGRVDSQLKIRGFRVEPGEIEAALLAHPVVRECVVVGREDTPGDKRLVAYVVAEHEPSGAAPNGGLPNGGVPNGGLPNDGALADALRGHLRDRLPAYMVPSAFVALETIPLTSSGKVDRRALPAPEYDRGALSRTFAAPTTPEETALAEIWARVLRVEQVGVDDNFFELGGDSILMIQVVDRARRAGLALTPRDVFRYPTVGELARLARPVDGEPRREPAAAAPAVRLGPVALERVGCAESDVEDAYPLSPMQQGLLFHGLTTESGSGEYHVQVRVPARGPLRAAEFRRAWEDVAARHTILRTAFVWEGVPEPMQVVLRRAPLPWREVDWRADDEAERAAKLARLLEADRVEGFELARAPLSRLTLVRTGDESYEVVWSMHHLLLDGWSTYVVLREVREAYEALLAGRPVPAAPARPYRDFIAELQRGDPGAEAFWRARLAGLAAPTPLGIDRRAPEGEPHRFTQASMALSAEQTSAVQAFAREHRVTFNTVVQGAWAILLGRYAGEEDVLFGATVTTRPPTLEGIDQMVGLFLNTLPVRVRVAPDAPVAEWLRALQGDEAEARAHEATPLTDVQRWSQVGGGTPLFESLLVFENYPGTDPFAGLVGGVSFGAIEILERPHYPLTLIAFPGERLALHAMYDASRFTPDAVSRMLAHLETVLRGMLAAPQAPVRSLEVMPADERRQLEAWAGPRVEYAGGATLVELLAAQAARTPNAIAVEDERRALTYAELDSAAAALARTLRGRGVRRGARVGVCAERSVELVIALVAAVKAGGAYVPFDPEYPRDRLAFMLEDADVAVLLATRGIAAALPPHGAPVVALDDVADARDDAAAAPLPVPNADDPAYMIYTSGSTGRPKGALNAHRGIVNRLQWMQSEYRLTSGDVVLQKTPFSFDVSVWEFFWPLLAGARLVMARPGGHRDTAYLAEVMTRRGVTVCHFVPSMLRAFLADPLAAGCASLRDVMASGEALPPDLAAAFHAALPNARLHNLYGPTECAVDVSYWPCPQSATPPEVVPIGRPVANTRLYVLDPSPRPGEAPRPVPIGVPGELYLAGVQVGLGYHNRPELTAERFVPDPYAPAEEGPNARMYRTGDRARWRADGTVEYLGRFDFQVKVRGFRIELGEIETTLLRHEGVHDCVVVVREDGGEKRLVAYYTPSASAEAPVDVSTLREYLLARLPDYMVPSAFVRLDALPLSANGKVDRKALPAPARGGDVAREYEAPRTPAETTIAQIWADVLRLERVGVHDNYFELGGDSILSIQIAARAREAGFKATVSMLAKHPTVAALAAALDNGATTVAADVGPSTGTAPLTPIQRWFFELDPAERDHWNQTFLFRTEEALDERALRGAVAELLRHHDALRLRFTRVDGEWTQRFEPSGAEAPVWVEDLSAVPDDGLTDAIADVAGRAARSLDIARGPCLRVTYMPLGGARGGRVLIVIHHLVVDGISWRILLEDLEAAYRALAAGETPRLPAKTTSFQQWAADLSAHATSPVLGAERAHWLAVSEGPVRALPLDGPADAPNTVGAAATLVAALDARETAELLQRVPHAYATQVNDVLLVALADALTPWVGAGPLLLDLEGHGREDIVPDLDLTRTVGWFTSVFPVRLELGAAGGGDVGRRLKAMKEMLRAVPRRGVGYGSLRYLVADAELASRPAPQLVFNYLGQFDQLVADSTLFRFADEDAGPWLSPAGRRRHVLEINSLVLNGRLEFRWTYGTKLHDAATIRRLADALLDALRAIIAHCATGAGGRTPSDFPLVRLTQEQVDRVAGDGKRVEEIAPVAPMQALFLATSAGGADVGFEQWRFEIAGALDVAAFRRAWQLMAARHEILRTSFQAVGLSSPVQVIARQAELPFVEHDWRAMDDATRGRELDALLVADRARGFRVDEAPLVRLTLIRTGDAAWTFVWSNHHLLLDRWSWPIVLREVGIAYEAFRAGRRPELPPAAPWRRYLAWLAARDNAPTEAFWRAALADVQARALDRLPGAGEEAGVGGGGGERDLTLTTDETARLRALARGRQVTLNTLVSAAWALWLARATGRADVVFGLSVAGRPEEVPGIERLVGMCINNVPLRVRVDGGDALGTLLARVDEGQDAANRHGYASLTDLQQWSGLPWHRRLFDTLVVFQHHGADDETANWLGAANPVRMVVDALHTNYPLALVVGGKDALALRLAYQGRFAGAEGADRVLAQLRTLLVALPEAADASPDAPLDALLERVPVYAADGEAAARRPITAPRDDVEWVVARVWAELLGRDAVGVDENFFDLGGQSLVATQIMSRMRDGLHMELPVSLLFEHPTVEAFARAVRQREAAPGRVERVAAIIRRVEEMTVQELREVGIHERA